MARLTERFERIFAYAFAYFFIAPAVVVVVLALAMPDRVNYGNSGLVLLLSVLGGALFGAMVGLVEYPRASRAEETEILWADELWDADLDS